MAAEKIISDFFTCFNSRDLERMRPMLAENAEFYFPKTQPLLGPDRVLKFLHILFRQYPELVFTVHRTIVQGNRGAVHWTNRGKNRRGEPYENEGHDPAGIRGRKDPLYKRLLQRHGKILTPSPFGGAPPQRAWPSGPSKGKSRPLILQGAGHFLD